MIKTLHICPNCESHLVHPLEWQDVIERGYNFWEIHLRCPNCEWEDENLYTQEEAEIFDQELDHGTDELVRGLKQLTLHNMEEEIARFSKALQTNALLPIDF